jgi:hypothetical protein
VRVTVFVPEGTSTRWCPITPYPLNVFSMSNGKRSFNISLGGSSAVGSKPNPFARTARPPSTKAALGFQDDSEDDGGGSSGPPKRKLFKLDHGLEDNDDQIESEDGGDNSALSRMTSTNVPPPPIRKPIHDDDAFSRLESRKGTMNPPPPLNHLFVRNRCASIIKHCQMPVVDD